MRGDVEEKYSDKERMIFDELTTMSLNDIKDLPEYYMLPKQFRDEMGNDVWKIRELLAFIEAQDAQYPNSSMFNFSNHWPLGYRPVDWSVIVRRMKLRGKYEAYLDDIELPSDYRRLDVWPIDWEDKIKRGSSHKRRRRRR